ncbi:MAG: glycoside hydrolase family 43 protein [Bacteroidota bacterium]
MTFLKNIKLILFLGLFAFSVRGQTPSNYSNPILAGFHPDPSVCRVGDDYYLVNSSFEWFPGLPVYHSKDLVNWELIGYGITRADQVPLPEGLPDSRVEYAPSIRYHDGLFYIINTCVSCEGNFYITATDPAGPWSDPVWLRSRGIDPDLFWDDDGRCYYVGHANITGVRDWPNKNGAWMQQLDLEKKKLVGERVQLTHGHAANARWTEGPHLYKINGKYILMVAEGGTGFHHAITVHYSDSLWGPYIPNHANPVLSHRHLGYDYPIHLVGHGDLIQTQNGEWWCTMLAKRKVDGYSLLARETFLTPVEFQEQEGQHTPVFNKGHGKLLSEQKRPDLPWSPIEKPEPKDEFESDKLALYWNMLRSPTSNWYKLNQGKLELKLRPEVVDSFVNPSLFMQRIEHHEFIASTLLDFQSAKPSEQAGLIIYRKSSNHYQLMKSGNDVVLIKSSNGQRQEIAREKWSNNQVFFKVEAKGLDARFYYGASETTLKSIGGVQNLSVIADEEAGGFNGPGIGMYATSNGQASKTVAKFDWFEYKGKSK